MTEMNLNKLPCVNTLLLNRHLAEIDREDAYSNEVDRRQAEIEEAGVTEDDVHELGESLQSRNGEFRNGLLLAIRAGINCDAMIRDELAKITEHRALNEALNSMDN